MVAVPPDHEFGGMHVDGHFWCHSKDLRLPVVLTKDATRYLVLSGMKMEPPSGLEPDIRSSEDPSLNPQAGIDILS